MKEFTSKQVKIQTAAAWELVAKAQQVGYYALYVGLDVHKDSIAKDQWVRTHCRGVMAVLESVSAR